MPVKATRNRGWHLLFTSWVTVLLWLWIDSMFWETNVNIAPREHTSVWATNYGSRIWLGIDLHTSWDLRYGRERVTGNTIVDTSRDRVWLPSLEVNAGENGVWSAHLPYWLILGVVSSAYGGVLLFGRRVVRPCTV